MQKKYEKRPNLKTIHWLPMAHSVSMTSIFGAKENHLIEMELVEYCLRILRVGAH